MLGSLGFYDEAAITWFTGRTWVPEAFLRQRFHITHSMLQTKPGIAASNASAPACTDLGSRPARGGKLLPLGPQANDD